MPTWVDRSNAKPESWLFATDRHTRQPLEYFPDWIGRTKRKPPKAVGISRRPSCLSGQLPNPPAAQANSKRQRRRGEWADDRPRRDIDPGMLDLTRPEDYGNSEAEARQRLLATEDSGGPMRCNDGSGRFATMFFSEEAQDIARAKHICATCPAMIPASVRSSGVSRGACGAARALPQREDPGRKRRRAGRRRWPGPRTRLPDIPIPRAPPGCESSGSPSS